MSSGVEVKVLERFLKDIEAHRLTVFRDDGVYRHLGFQAPGTIIYGFELITWPGYLAITGDCGSYVFKRVNDMFGFFGMDDLKHVEKSWLYINPDYWTQKCVAEDRNSSGITRFSSDALEQHVTDYVDGYFLDRDRDDHGLTHDQLWPVIEEEIFSKITTNDAKEALSDFSYRGFSFGDCWEWKLEDFDELYLWCLYAIVWGIKQYDQYVKSKVVV